MIGVQWDLPGALTLTCTVISPESVVSTAISSYRASAMPRLSNPGPRLALDAATVALAVSPTGSVRVIRSGQSELFDDGRRVDRQRCHRRHALLSAVWGPLRPLPVTVHTTVEPVGPSRPDRLEQSGDAGRGRGLDEHALGARNQVVRGRISSSVAATKRPPDSSCAATADDHEAGEPIRMAVAMVSWALTAPQHQRRGAGGLGAQHPR